MNNFYLVTKQEFNSLYRFGMIPLIKSKVIDAVNKNSSELDDMIYNEFLSLPFFVGDEEYLIINFENNLVDNTWLEIENVLEIIPLTRAAKNSIQLKFDTRIRFKDARFEHVIHRVEEYIDIQERFRGAKAFCKLCQIDAASQDFVSKEVITKSYYNKINGRKSEEFKDEFLVHLLSYDRYDFFPNSDLGFYYDIGQIFAHSKGKSSLVGSNFYAFLENHKQELLELDFLQIAQIISNSDAIQKFTDHLTINEIRIYLASALFLKFKNDLSERETIKGSETGRLIKKVRNESYLVKELNLAIYLTGAFFGYQKFYDDLYDLVGLKIFNEKIKPSSGDIKIDENSDKERKEKNNLNSPEMDNKLTSITSETDKDINQEIAKNNEEISKIEPAPEESLQVEISANDADVALDEPLIIENELSENRLEQRDDEENNYQSTSIEQINISSEIAPNEKIILDLLLKFIEEGKGVFELKSNRLNEVKNAISSANIEKNNLKKEDIVQYIRQSFEASIDIELKGNKCVIKKKIANGLFND